MIKSSLKNGFTVEHSTRDIQWYGDEPLDLGGNNAGPTPTEQVLSALASCKLITMRMYAQRKEWDLQNAHISLEIVDRKEKAIIQKSIIFDGDLSEEQVKRLKDISGRCPVAKMLSASVEFIWA